MRAAALVLALSLFPSVSPLTAQEVVLPRTLEWALGGAIFGGLGGLLIGGLMNGAASGSLDEALTFADAIGRRGTPDPDHPCFDKNCALIGAGIGAGAGFVIGAIAGATTAPRAAGGRRRPQPPPLCSGRQR